MRILRNIFLAFLVLGMLNACIGIFGEEEYYYEETDEANDAKYEHCSAIVWDDGGASCARNSGQYTSTGAMTDVYNVPSEVTVAGVKICPPRNRCPDDGRLPPQPCEQPIPEYYGNVSQEMIEDGIVLIHPYTRTQVICLAMPGDETIDCAQNFRAAGFVLITDIPQLPAKYDFLKGGTYPTRRWRGKGEVVPRW